MKWLAGGCGFLLLPGMFVVVILIGAATPPPEACAGATAGGGYTGAGVAGLSPTQTARAAAILAEGRSMGVPDQGVIVALATASQESNFRVLANDGQWPSYPGEHLAPEQRGVGASLKLPRDGVGTDHASLGLFQQQWPWWGTMAELMDPATSARKFYSRLLAIPGWQRLPVTVAAQRVQRSAYPDAYADDAPRARELLRQLDDPDTGLPLVGSSTGPGTGGGYELVNTGGDVQPQTQALVDHLAPRFGITTVGGYRPDAHDPTGHPAGLAADFMVDDRATGDALAAYATEHAAELGIKYVLWWQRSWSPQRGTWQPMSDRGSATANHRDHVHISLNPIGVATTGNTGSATAAEDPACVLAAAGPGTLQVATYNVLGYNHDTSRSPYPNRGRMRAAAGLLLAEGVQAFTGTEVHAAERRDLLAHLPGWEATSVRGSDDVVVFWDAAVLDKVEAGAFPIPVMPGRPARSQPWVRLRHRASGGQVVVFGVHLSLNPVLQRTGAAKTVETIRRVVAGSGLPFVLAGDMNGNDRRSPAAYRLFRASGLMSSARDLTTSKTGDHCDSHNRRWGSGAQECRRGRGSHIDQIWVSTHPATTVDSYRLEATVETSRISDHNPLLADMTVPGFGQADGQIIDGPSRDGWVWPVPGVTTLGSVGYGGPGSRGTHKGIDIGASGGGSLGKPVVAAHDGTVARVWGQTSGCGAFVSIQATGTSAYAAYQHLAGDSLTVTAGDQVEAGQVIGRIGRTGGGRCGTDGFYHLHFSIESQPGTVSEWADPYPGSTIDPLKVLPSPNRA